MAKHSVKSEKTAPARPVVAPSIPPAFVSDDRISPVSTSEKDPMIPRLGVPFDPKTGKIVFEGMRASTKDKIRMLLDDDRIPKELGISSGTTATVDPEMDALAALIVNGLYDAIGSLAVIAAKSRGYGEHAEILRYTQEEKDKFGPPTLKVLSKYDLLGGKYADELLLVVAVGSVTAGRIMAMTHAANARSPVTVIRESEKVS